MTVLPTALRTTAPHITDPRMVAAHTVAMLALRLHLVACMAPVSTARNTKSTRSIEAEEAVARPAAALIQIKRLARISKACNDEVFFEAMAAFWIHSRHFHLLCGFLLKGHFMISDLGMIPMTLFLPARQELRDHSPDQMRNEYQRI